MSAMTKPKKSAKATERKRRRVSDTTADWGGVDPELLASVVATVTAHGGAIRFGYSRDGGAYSVGIYGDGEPFTEYLGATADIVEWLEGIRDDYS